MSKESSCFLIEKFVADCNKSMKTDGISVRNLAALTELPRATIHNITSGRNTVINTEHFLNLCYCLELEPKDYFNKKYFK